MENYDINYQLLNYDSYNKRLYDLVNGDYKNKVIKLDNLGYSSCGFPIEHYSIGNGPMHIVYMGGCHGNEIIGVDYVTQLMKNIAMGTGVFSDIDLSMFTFDFIPLQNPEGFYITTYALKQMTDGMNEEEIEKFSKDYYVVYGRDDKNVLGINNLLKSFFLKYNIDLDVNEFWDKYRFKDINKACIIEFLSNKCSVDLDRVNEFVNSAWDNEKLLKGIDVISSKKKHHEYFDGVTFDCIPEIDDRHKMLKSKIIKMYKENGYPIGSLANFFANSDGVNLNDNNEVYYNFLRGCVANGEVIYCRLRDNNIPKSIPSPCGCPNYDMNKEFKYANENEALLNYLKNNRNYMFVNCHGTGGMLYVYPYDNERRNINDFTFYINNRIATEYSKTTDEIYQKFNNSDGYRVLGYPENMTGLGDVMRQKYSASLLLELSKMGGNPIAPYGDRFGNYYLTMIANFEGTKKALDTIKSMSHLYDLEYTISYDDNGRVSYSVDKKRGL